MAFKYVPFTRKQLQLLSWWTPESPYSEYNGIIAEGAVRAGKTIVMGLSFIFWAMQKGSGLNFAICGKTVNSTRRNIIEPLKGMLKKRGYKVIDKRTEGYLKVARKKRVNTFYIFGGKDESSASLIQGVTLAGILFDEVALMPRSFVDQGIARCSVEGSKYWFNCNPEGPRHWFKTDHIDDAKNKKYLVLHFNLEDNPSLSDEMVDRYKSMFTGIFYRRFILGEWAFADGVIYSNIPERCFFTDAQADQVVPVKIREHDLKPWYSSDYGTTNPQIYLEIYKYKAPDSKIPYFYVTNEYCWNSKKTFHQKTDAEYVADFEDFRLESHKGLIIDPSAESLKVAHERRGHLVINAKNDVRPGIGMVSTLFALGHIFINQDRCPNLVAELGLYQWDPKKSEAGKEEPIKQNDHSCDALRYGIFTTTTEFEVYGYKK